MNKINRNRLLSLARFPDRRAQAIRAYVKRKTPARKPRKPRLEVVERKISGV